MAGRRSAPAERVRGRLREVAGEEVASAMPLGYQRLGRVLVVRLPPPLAPYGALVGEAWRKELGVAAVLEQRGPVVGELREPNVRFLAGSSAVTEVVEHGTHWRLDAARLMFAAGNRTERLRIARAVRPGERVADLFAGIGYFTVPAARAQPEAGFVAVEKNPIAFRYLEENARLNGVDRRVRAILGDNRAVELDRGAFDRVVMGYLPSALPWLPRAVELLAPPAGTVHVHLVVDARDALARAAREVAVGVDRCGATLAQPPRAREVKPYGPGRTHVVVDALVRPS